MLYKATLVAWNKISSENPKVLYPKQMQIKHVYSEGLLHESKNSSVITKH